MATDSNLKDLTIIFVLDPPALTGESLILLSSIRHVLGNDVNVIAYCPQAKSDFLLPYIEEFYQAMNAEIRLMEPTDRFNPFYKQGNKILACLQKRDTKYTMFLDTDTIIASEFSCSDLFVDGAVSIVPEGVQTWGKPEGWWEQVYTKFGLPMPTETVSLTRSGALSAPYFNGGMIGFETASDFAESWFHIATELDSDPDVPSKRPWLDQIALPLAIKHAGLKYNILGKEWNLTISHPGKEHLMKPFFDQVNSLDAKIIHFHRASYFTGTRYKEIADTALARYTHFDTLSDLTADADRHAKHRQEVWAKFGYLKNLAERTEEETRELYQLGDEKNRIKALEQAHGTDPLAVAAVSPKSILRK